MKHKELFDGAKLLYIVSFAALLLALAGINLYSAMSSASLYIELLLIGIFALYSYLYFYVPQALESNKLGLALSASMLALLAFSLFYPRYMSYAISGNFVNNAYLIGLVALFYAPLFAIMHFSRYYYMRGNRIIAILLIVVVVAVLIYYIYYFKYPLNYEPNDEIYISFLSVHSFLSGGNPYTANYTSYIMANSQAFGATFTTGNGIINHFSYPAAYLYAVLPFYAVTKFSLQNMSNVDLKLQAIVFLSALLFVIYYFGFKDRQNRLPDFYVIVFLGLGLMYELSAVELLMMAVILLAYFKAERWYAFILLGIAASLQEELWLPVILLLIYLWNINGFRSALKTAMGALAVFVFINSYFISLAPTAFFKSIVSPIGSYILPNSLAPIGYYLLTHVHILISSFVILDAIVVAALLLLYRGFGSNKKELIPLFSLFFIFFLHTGQWEYYSFFALMFVVALAAANVGMRTVYSNRFKARVRSRTRSHHIAYCAAFALLLAFFAAETLYSHSMFLSEYNLSISNQTMQISRNFTAYNATIYYSNISHKTLFLTLLATFDNSTAYYGISSGFRLLVSPHYSACSSFGCRLNPNIFYLNGSGRVGMAIRVGAAEESGMIVIVYNGSYFYASRSIRPG